MGLVSFSIVFVVTETVVVVGQQGYLLNGKPVLPPKKFSNSKKLVLFITKT